MGRPGITIDNREFRETMREYRKFTKRDLATILNTKAFYIARGAVRNTLKASKEQIQWELTDPDFSYSGAPIAALLVNKRRGAQGKKGLYGARMERAVNSLANARVLTRAFIAAGFLEAVKIFGGVAEKKNRAPRSDPSVKQRGRAKGSGTIARESWTPRATIENGARTRRETHDALMKYGGDGLQEAFDEEVASMKQYIEDKLQATADRVSSQH